MTRDEIERRAAALLRQAHTIKIAEATDSASRIIFGENLAAALVEMWDAACDEGIRVVDEGWELWEIKDQLRAKKLGSQR